jgi:tetraacyldisaccharide 4'-kinase
VRPGVLLRGYGGDEIGVHEARTPEAIVVADPDRRAGAARAAALGAGVLVLDDAFQRLDVARDANIAVVSTESATVSRWLLPAGPWREGWSALARATLIVVTRKRAAAGAAAALRERLAGRVPGCPIAIAHLAVGGLAGMVSGVAVAPGRVAGRPVLAAAGIADPRSFAAQLAELGATVQLQAFQDHHPYGGADVRRLVQAAGAVDYLIVTEKDAVKLRHQWPRDVREPLVALLEVRWDAGAEAVGRALDGALARPRPGTPSPTTDRT